jgi:hypothetical protein
MDSNKLYWGLFSAGSAGAFIIGVLLVVFSGDGAAGHWALRSPTGWFLLITVAVFALNVALSAFQLRCYDRFRSACSDYLAASRVAPVERAIRHQLPQGDGPRDSGEAVDLAERLLSSLLGDQRVSHPRALGRTILTPLRNRVVSIRESVLAGREDPPTIRMNLDGLSQRIEEPPSLRFLNQTLVNVLLFTGIIGTFYGLVLLVSGSAMQDILSSFQEPGELSSRNLSELFQGFETAFGSSLVAYLTYVAGRLSLDLTDEAFETSASATIATVQDRLARAFSFGNIIAHVDLDPGSKRLLEQNVRALRILVQQSDKLNQSIAGMLPRLEGAAHALEQATTNGAAMANRIEQALAQGQASWTAASKSFLAAANKLDGVTQKITSDLSAAGDNLTANVADLGNHVGNIRQVWSQNMTQLAQLLTQSVNDFKAHLDAFAQGMQSQIADYQQTKSLLDQIAQQTNAGRAALSARIGDLQMLLQHSGQQTRAALDQLTRQWRQDCGAQTQRLADLASQMDRAADTLREIETLLGAERDGQPLPELLVAIRRSIDQQNDLLAQLASVGGQRGFTGL